MMTKSPVQLDREIAEALASPPSSAPSPIKRATPSKPTKRTYPQARADLLKHLAATGWQVSPGLKIPHATSPDGKLRLWFKPQAIWFTDLQAEQGFYGGGKSRHDFHDARTLSYDLDIRALSSEQFVGMIARHFPGHLVAFP